MDDLCISDCDNTGYMLTFSMYKYRVEDIQGNVIEPKMEDGKLRVTAGINDGNNDRDLFELDMSKNDAIRLRDMLNEIYPIQND